MKRHWILPAIVLAFACGARADEPLDAARSYYTWALSHAGRGLPSAGHRAEMAAFLTPDLVKLFESASQTEQRCIKSATKGEKPLIVEGDMLVSNLEGASEVAYGVPQVDGDSASMEVSLMYIDRRFAKGHPHRVVAWHDQLDFARTGGRWRVKEAHFPPDRSLGEELRGYIQEGQASCAIP
jgi:hypothetical protein